MHHLSLLSLQQLYPFLHRLDSKQLQPLPRPLKSEWLHFLLVPLRHFLLYLQLLKSSFQLPASVPRVRSLNFWLVFPVIPVPALLQSLLFSGHPFYLGEYPVQRLVLMPLFQFPVFPWFPELPEIIIFAFAKEVLYWKGRFLIICLHLSKSAVRLIYLIVCLLWLCLALWLSHQFQP